MKPGCRCLCVVYCFWHTESTSLSYHQFVTRFTELWLLCGLILAQRDESALICRLVVWTTGHGLYYGIFRPSLILGVFSSALVPSFYAFCAEAGFLP